MGVKSLPDIDNLPQELKDLIVDHISHISDETERKQTLRSTALVSRRFRYWAHKRLFATVVLRGKHGKVPISIIGRLRELKELIAADPFSDKTGIASHIRSFTLSLGGHRSCVAPPLEDDALPFILQKLHRTGSRPRSLSILLFMPGDNDQLDWSTLNLEFRRALVDVSRSPLLTTLRLRGFRNLPRDILTGASVENIKFNNISVKDYNQGVSKSLSRYSWKEDQLWNDGFVYFPEPLLQATESSNQALDVDTTSNSLVPASVVPSNLFVTPLSPQCIPSPSTGSDASEVHSYPDYVHLESIETDHTFPILHVLDLTPTRSHLAAFIFQKLKNLTMNIRDESGFKKAAEIFDSAPTVEKLEIKLNCESLLRRLVFFLLSNHFTLLQGTGISTDALSLLPLGRLKHLRLIHRLATPGFNTVATGHPHPTVQDMINLLTYSEIPKTLRRISITLSLKPQSYYCLFQAPVQEGNSTNSSPAATESSNGPNAEASSSSLTGVVTTSISDSPNSESTSCVTPSINLLIKRLFATCSRVLKPLDDLLGYPTLSTQTRDRFADINYYTIRLEVDLYTVPEGFTKQKEKEFAEEAAEYVKSRYFPKLNERFEKVDQVTSERKSGGFGVVVTPRSRNSLNLLST